MANSRSLSTGATRLKTGSWRNVINDLQFFDQQIQANAVQQVSETD